MTPHFPVLLLNLTDFLPSRATKTCNFYRLWQLFAELSPSAPGVTKLVHISGCRAQGAEINPIPHSNHTNWLVSVITQVPVRPTPILTHSAMWNPSVESSNRWGWRNLTIYHMYAFPSMAASSHEDQTFGAFFFISRVAVSRKSFWYMTLGPSSQSCVFVSIWVYLWILQIQVVDFLWSSLDFLGRCSKTVILIYDTWANLLSTMCICWVLGVFGCICGFYKYKLWICLWFSLDLLDWGSKTVILIYDTWANLLSIMCICGFWGVFGCICGFYKYNFWIFCQFFCISWVRVARRSFLYMTLRPISSRSCVFVDICWYLLVFVDFTNTICGFILYFFGFPGSG
jgi:hypothetical protein